MIEASSAADSAPSSGAAKQALLPDAARVAQGRQAYDDQLSALARSDVLEDLRGRTTVVIGATGLLGSALMRSLSELSARDPSQKTRIIGVARRQRQPLPGTSFVSGSASDPALYRTLPRADFVLYVAGNTSDATQRPRETIDITVNGLALCLEYGRAAKGLVFVSSARVYGDQLAPGPISEDSLAEVHPMAIANLYASSKRLAESLLLADHERLGTPGTVVRLSNIYGPYLSNISGHFLGELVGTILSERQVTMRGHPDSIRNYCFASDAAEGLLRALVLGRRGVAYNIASNENLSNHEFIASVKNTLPFESTIVVPPVASTMPRTLGVISVDRALLDLEYRPARTIDECLPFAVSWVAEALAKTGGP